MCDVLETRRCVETTVFMDANHRQMCSLIINRQLMHILVGLCVCPGTSEGCECVMVCVWLGVSAGSQGHTARGRKAIQAWR